MDFMRKLVRGSTVISSSSSTSSDNTYELLTLRRKFLEISHSQRPTSTKDQEDKLYSMLPLFYEIFISAPPKSMREKFGDVLQFATQVSRLMVTEIRRRASDKTTEEASAAITDFLLVQDIEEKSRGWILLNVLSLLAAGGQNVVDCMTTMHLPSTLVKCLYLFFDLPPISLVVEGPNPSEGSLHNAGHNADPNTTPKKSDNATNRLQNQTPVAASPKYTKFQQGSRVRVASALQKQTLARKESGKQALMEHAKSSTSIKRMELQKVFVQTLVRLCKHISPAEELSHRDDLGLLFSAVTSWCPPHNSVWRQAASEVLNVISRHGLSHNVVQYIRSKHCISTCIDNLRRSMHSSMKSATSDAQEISLSTEGEISDLDLVDALVSIMRFVRDTADVTQMILEDFRQCNGYGFLTEFLLRLELLAEGSENHREGVRSIVSNLEILTTSGFVELNPGPAVQASPFQAHFEVPEPVGKGASVRNLQAFQVLEQAFIRGRTSLLCLGVLDGILNVYRRDPANYFILAGQHTLSTFAEPLLEKRFDVLSKYFSLLEFVALELSFVPCKELVSLTLILKDDRSLQCSIACVESLRKIIASNSKLYREVYREVGVLEVLVTCLHKYAAVLKSSDELEESRTRLGQLSMELLAELLKNCPANAGVFRETGGARCAHNLVPFSESRSRALNIVETLILQPPGSSSDDDDMGTLLGLLSTVPPKDLILKTDILKSLLKVITESRDARIVFRKVGGFINVISVLVSVEGCLEDPPVGLWAALQLHDILKLLEVTFQTLCVALRLPSNKRFFHAEVQFESLRSAVRYLGCFTDDCEVEKLIAKGEKETDNATNTNEKLSDLKPSDLPLITSSLGSLDPISLLSSSLPSSEKSHQIWTNNCVSVLSVFRFLYLLATDSFKDEVLCKILQLEDQKSSSTTTSPDSISSKSSPSHDYHHKNIPHCHHSLVIDIMMLLVPVIPARPSRQMQIDLQYYILEQINSLLNLERNEQILCKSGLLSTLLRNYSDILCDDSHPLNSAIQRIMERLATQTVSPRELRDFLRIGDPLHCKDEFISNGTISLSRVKNLVSMSTPRNMGFQEDGAVNYFNLPGFIEFDMNRQGCSYLFIPSLFPQAAYTSSVVGQTDASIISGIGIGERPFPPPAGLAVSAWVYIEKFCPHQLHPIRLLTVTREVNINNSQVQYTCLSIHITAKDKNIIISTQEENFEHMGPGDIEIGNELISASAVFPTKKSIHESQWYHIVVVINKATVLKHSTAAAYLNGRLLGTSKLRYIHTNPGGNSANSAIQVRAYVGTPPRLSARSPLLWRLASFHIADDSSFVTASSVATQYQLGPSYIGNFQAVPLSDGGFGPVLSEEHLCFSLHPHACETSSGARIRRQCMKFDSKSIANELKLGLNDGLTPIILVRNSCSHMPGLARSVGAVAVYDQASAAVRNFMPGQVARVLQNVGGSAVILSLVSMATDVEGLYAAVKSLVCIVKNNQAAANEMDRKRGYQALAMHLKRKKALLNSHVLHLTYSLAGTVDVGRESATIPNITAFEDLLCDLEVWHNAPDELHRSLLEHIYGLLTESSDTNENCKIIKERGMVKRCLHFVFGDSSLSLGTIRAIFRIIQALLNTSGNHSDLLRFGQFLVSTIPPLDEYETSIELSEPETDFKKCTPVSTSADPTRMNNNVCERTIHMRNMGIKLLRECLYEDASGKPNITFCEDIQRTLGWDWMLLFMQENIHSSTVVEITLLLLETLRCGSTGFKYSHHSSSVSSSSLSSAALSTSSSLVGAAGVAVTGISSNSTSYNTAYERFKYGELCGGWLDGTEAILESSADSLLGFNVGSASDKPYHRQVCRESCSIAGFSALATYLLRHMNSPRLYIALLQFAVSDKLSDPPDLKQIDLDTMYEYIFGLNANAGGPASPRSKLKPSSSFTGISQSNQASVAMSLEIFQVILSMVRSMINQKWQNEPSTSWLQTYPIVMLQTLIFIYQFNYNSLASVFVSHDFISYLCATIFPTEDNTFYMVPYFSISGTNSKTATSSVPTTPNEENPNNIPASFTSDTLNKESLLSTHPCKKFIFSLIQHIIFDSLSLPSTSSNSGKHAQVIDIILEFSPERCTTSQLKEFQTDIINHLFSNLIAAEPFLGETGVLLTHGNLSHTGNANTKKGNSNVGAAYDNIQQNVAYFASRVVDRVWLDMYNQDTKTIFEFIRKLVVQGRHKASKCSSSLLDSLYRSLYRVILYQLSRRHQSVSEQMTVLDALHSLTSNQELIFDAKRNDHLFVSGLCHCLFMLSGDSAGVGFGVEEIQRQTTWHIVNHDNTVSEIETAEEAENPSGPGQPATPQEKGKILLSKSAARVWGELMSSKKNSVEDIFKVSFHDLGSSQSNLDSARLRIKESAAKLWSNYLTLEKKGQAGTKEIVYLNKLAKKMSSLAMLGSGRKTKKETGNKSHRHFTLQDSTVWALNHMTVVQDLVNFQHNSFRQDQDHLVRYADEEWTEIEKELVRERGVWGPEKPTSLHKWMLDSTEGPCRMRKKMTRNDNFYEHYPHRTKEEIVLLKMKHRKPISKDSIKQYMHIHGLPPEYEDDVEESIIASNRIPKPVPKQDSTDSLSENEVDNEVNKSEISSEINEKIVSNSDDIGDQDTVVENGSILDETLTEKQDKKLFDNESDSTSSTDESHTEAEATFTEDAENNAEDVKKTEVAESDGISETDELPDLVEVGQNSNKDDKANQDSTKEFPTSESQASLVEQENKPDNQTVLRLLEDGEKIRHMFRCARVQGLDTYEGLLLFGKDNFYIIDGFTMLKSKEIREIVSLPPAYHEPIIPQQSRPGHNPDDDPNKPFEAPPSLASYSHLCSRFSYDHIREVHKRRYLLQDIALEVFSSDGRNYLIVFPQGTRNKVYQKFVSFATTLADNSKDLVIGQKSNVNIEQQGPALLTNIMGEKTVTQRWERGEISNFQYLMYINTLAGRSYNDLMQYPVFPWVLADYTSEVLDLTNPKTFRDFSKPMGAQTSDRLQQFKKRYREWEDLGGDTPPYHYGTHYSSAMIVASYLVRMEPFTQHFLRLQGGHFDLADRMFHSIGDAWHSASEKNMADVKELIPEFFYLPEFLLNSNNFDLGQKQNGIRLDDIILPTWAKGSTREFIRVHREALECDYVSAHLHEWIDLVFGFKQKGEPALESHNVFHHLFYEGEVDIYTIEDPLRRSATIGFINNFGQIPKQLFKKPHMQKRISLKPPTQEQEISVALSLSPSAFGAGPPLDKVFYRHLDNLKCSSGPVKELKGPVGEIVITDRGALATEESKILIPSQYSRYLSWGSGDLSIRIGYYESERAMQIFENLDCGEIKCVTMPNETTLVTGGTSTVVYVWKLPSPKDKIKNLQLKQSLYAHTDTVTCLASCSAYGILVSGSQDCTCIVWNLNRLSFVRQLRGHKSGVAHTSINELTGDIVTSDNTHVHVWSINGDHVASVNTTLMNARRQHITAIAISKLNEWDYDSVIATGHSDGYVRFWRLEYVQVPEQSKSGEHDDQQSIKSMGQYDIVNRTKPLTLAHDVKSLDSLSIASGNVGSDFAIAEKAQSVDSLSQVPTFKLKDKILTKASAPDTISVLSMGELAVLPWNDVPALELANSKAKDDFTLAAEQMFPEVKNVAGNSRISLTSSTENLSAKNNKKKDTDNMEAGYVRVESTRTDNEQSGSPSHSAKQAEKTTNRGSPTSSTDESFVMVDKKHVETQQAKDARLLLPGFVWQQQLILKGKIQVDQAIDKTGRLVVPDITAIAMSKDHHKIYVGDKMGRIYSWMSAD
ncbi:WD repeat and FYVE domain-containing protein 3-like [Styela clava]